MFDPPKQNQEKAIDLSNQLSTSDHLMVLDLKKDLSNQDNSQKDEITMIMNLPRDDSKMQESEAEQQQVKRKYSLIIAENILESPCERNFRDNKNNNIWGMRDIDLRERVDHNFSIEENQKVKEYTECMSKCNNCAKLQKEILKKQ